MSPALQPARTGVFGGTFNPLHVGHLRAAEEVLETLGLERMIFVPSAKPPHKTDADTIAPARLRLDWVERAIADHPRFEVDPLEVERGGRSFLVDTLEAIGRRTEPDRPVFVLGCDAFAEMDDWREPATLFTLAHWAVMTRPPGSGGLTEWLPSCVRDEVEIDRDGRLARHRSADTWIRLLRVTALDVSSTDVRRRIADGRSVRYLLPESIRETVLKSEAYRA